MQQPSSFRASGSDHDACGDCGLGMNRNEAFEPLMGTLSTIRQGVFNIRTSHGLRSGHLRNYRPFSVANKRLLCSALIQRQPGLFVKGLPRSQNSNVITFHFSSILNIFRLQNQIHPWRPLSNEYLISPSPNSNKPFSPPNWKQHNQMPRCPLSTTSSGHPPLWRV